MPKEDEVKAISCHLKLFLGWPLARQLTLSYIICLHKTLTPIKLALNTSSCIFQYHVSAHAVPLLERPSLFISLLKLAQYSNSVKFPVKIAQP